MCVHDSVTDLEADGADVVVLLQLLSRRPGEGVDLLGRFLSEQEAPPAGLTSEPNVEVWVDDDDGGAHPAPLPEQRLPGAVSHHAERHHELQHPADGVHPVDHFVQALNRVAAKQLHHEEGVDQQGAGNLDTYNTTDQDGFRSKVQISSGEAYRFSKWGRWGGVILHF